MDFDQETPSQEEYIDPAEYKKMQNEVYRLRSDNKALTAYIERMQRSIKALIDLQYSIDHMNSGTDVLLLIKKMLASALDAVDSENGSLMIVDETGRELVFLEVIGGARDRLINHRIPINKGIVGWSIEKRQVRLVENVNLDPLFSNVVDMKTGLKTDTLICVPLYDGNRALGAIEAINTRTGKPFDKSDKEVMEVVGRLAALALVEAEKSA